MVFLAEKVQHPGKYVMLLVKYIKFPERYKFLQRHIKFLAEYVTTFPKICIKFLGR